MSCISHKIISSTYLKKAYIRSIYIYKKMTLAKEIIRITTKTVLNSFKNEGIHPKSNPLHTLMYKTCLTSPRFTLYLLSAHIWWLANSTYCSLPHHQRPQTFAKCISHRNNFVSPAYTETKCHCIHNQKYTTFSFWQTQTHAQHAHTTLLYAGK